MNKLTIIILLLIGLFLSADLLAQTTINVSQDEECCPDNTTPTSRLGNLQTCDLFATGGILTSGFFENRFSDNTGDENFAAVLGKNGIIYDSQIAENEAQSILTATDDFSHIFVGVPSLGSDNIDFQALEHFNSVYLGILKESGDFLWRRSSEDELVLETNTYIPNNQWENTILGPSVVGRNDLTADTVSIPNQGVLAADGVTPLKFSRILSITSNDGGYALAFCLGTDSLIYSWGGRLNGTQQRPAPNTLFRDSPSLLDAATPKPATFLNNVFTDFNTSLYFHDDEYDVGRTFWASVSPSGVSDDEAVAAIITDDGLVNFFYTGSQNGQVPHRLQCPNGERAVAVQQLPNTGTGVTFLVLSDAGHLYADPWGATSNIPATPSATPVVLDPTSNRFNNFGVLSSGGEKIIDFAWESTFLPLVLTDQGNVYNGKSFGENTLAELDNLTITMGLPPIKRFIDSRTELHGVMLAETMDGYNIVFRGTGEDLEPIGTNALINSGTHWIFSIDINGQPWPDRDNYPYTVLWDCINPWR